MKSLQTKFLTVNICSMVVLALLVGGMGIFTTSRLLQRDANRMLDMVCDLEKEQLHQLLGGVEQSVHIMVTQSLKELESVEKISNDVEYREKYTLHMLDLYHNVASHTDGIVAYYLRYNPEIAPSTDGFFWSKENGSDEFQAFPPTDILAYDPSDTEHVGWYYIPVENCGPTWVMPYQNHNNDCYMISYVVPLYVEEQLVGVVGLDVDFTMILEWVDAVEIYETGHAYLMDGSNTIIYHKDLPVGAAKPHAGNNTLEHDVALENGMHFVVTVSKAEVYHDRDSLAVEIILLCTIVAGTFIIITIVLTKRLIGRLRELTVAAQRMKEGEFLFTPGKHANDEIAVLSESFRNAGEHLYEQMTHINGLAYRDSLTGVKNATAYREAVRVLEGKIAIKSAEFAIAILDINFLKKTNDSYGHEAGNLLIQECSRLICRIFKHSPVYRIGGDEFAVILERNDYKKREHLTKKFFNEVSNTFITVDEKKIPVSIALGIAEFIPEEDSLYHDVFQRADERMYENKATIKRAAEQSQA